MSRRLCSLLLVAAIVGPVAASVYAQSLADVARKEEERRKAIKQPSKVYTNDDVGGPKLGTLSSAADTSKADAEKASDSANDAKDKKDGKESKDAKDASGSGDEKKSDAADPAKDQAYWRGRMQALQTQLDHDQGYADALQVKINALTTDFVNRDDPAQKMAIQRDRDKALSELDRLKKAVIDDKKAMASLEEDARRAGVPPGWLR